MAITAMVIWTRAPMADESPGVRQFFEETVSDVDFFSAEGLERRTGTELLDRWKNRQATTIVSRGRGVLKSMSARLTLHEAPERSSLSPELASVASHARGLALTDDGLSFDEMRARFMEALKALPAGGRSEVLQELTEWTTEASWSVSAGEPPGSDQGIVIVRTTQHVSFDATTLAPSSTHDASPQGTLQSAIISSAGLHLVLGAGSFSIDRYPRSQLPEVLASGRTDQGGGAGFPFWTTGIVDRLPHPAFLTAPKVEGRIGENWGTLVFLMGNGGFQTKALIDLDANASIASVTSFVGPDAVTMGLTQWQDAPPVEEGDARGWRTTSAGLTSPSRLGMLGVAGLTETTIWPVATGQRIPEVSGNSIPDLVAEMEEAHGRWSPVPGTSRPIVVRDHRFDPPAMYRWSWPLPSDEQILGWYQQAKASGTESRLLGDPSNLPVTHRRMQGATSPVTTAGSHSGTSLTEPPKPLRPHLLLWSSWLWWGAGVAGAVSVLLFLAGWQRRRSRT